jgi:hypothetical protein
LLDPAGGRYAITTFPVEGAKDGTDFGETPTLADWSGDGRHALFMDQGTNVGGKFQTTMTDIDLTTGTKQTFTVPGAQHVNPFVSAEYTRPTGQAVLLTTTNAGNGPQTSTLKRIDLSGHEQLTYPADLGAAGTFGGGYLELADGTQLVFGASNGLVMVGNDGVVGKPLPVPGVSGCSPVRSWTSTVILARCDIGEFPDSASQLWQVPLDGGAPDGAHRTQLRPGGLGFRAGPRRRERLAASKRHVPPVRGGMRLDVPVPLDSRWAHHEGDRSRRRQQRPRRRRDGRRVGADGQAGVRRQHLTSDLQPVGQHHQRAARATRQRRRREGRPAIPRRNVIKARIAVIAALVPLAMGISGWGSAAPSQQATGTPTPASRQSVLPFTGLEGPHDVSVDTTGGVYVDDTHTFKDDKGFPDATTRLQELAAGSNTQTQLPFTRSDLVVDPAGTAYAFDYGNDRMVKLANGPDAQTEVVVPGLGLHGRVVAVDTAGNLYDVEGGGVDTGDGCCVPVQVVKLADGTNTRTVLPFTGLSARTTPRWTRPVTSSSSTTIGC